MLFNSYVFLLFFFPIIFIGYRLLTKYCPFVWAKTFLVIGSLYFYAYFKPSYLIIILASILLNYFMCQQIWRSPRINIRKLMLILGCTLNVGILVYFKYTGFLLENINLLLGTKFPIFNILLPLGISFYTFQQLSFIIDAYNKKNNFIGFIDYALFVTFFPQLIAGPIVLPSEMLPQFDDTNKRSINWKNMNSGLFLFACGLAKKCFLADTLAIIADIGFNSNTPLNISEAWFVSLAFSFQLYFDFSGYCDMAMGIGKFFNIDLPLNFNSPYKSTNFQDFWRRWHITLGRFMMNYLYIPLGGNKSGIIRTLINLLIVFIVSGIWHGAGWLFLLWGAFHGFGILVNRLWTKVILKKYPKLEIPNIPAIVITFLFVNFFWVFFRATTLTRAKDILTSMFDFSNVVWLSKAFRHAITEYGFSQDCVFFISVIGILIAFVSPNSFEMDQILQKKTKLRSALTILFFVIGFLCVGRLSPFLYFNF